MKKWIFTLIFVFSLLSLTKATVIFDPADYTDSAWTMAGDSKEIVQLNGNSYLKIYIDGWNTTFSLPAEITLSEGETAFKCFSQYAVGTSGIDQATINSFIQLVSPDWSIKSAIGAASDDSIAYYSVDLTASQTVGVLQFAGQNTADGGTALVGDTMWISRIVSYNPDYVFQPDGHAGAFPAGTEIVVIDGKSFAKVPIDGWNNMIDLDATFNTGAAASFNTESQYKVGTSGLDISGINTFIQLMGSPSNLSAAAASSATLKTYSKDFSEPMLVKQIQLAGQNTTGWDPVPGVDTLWIGDVKTVTPSAPGVVFDPATYPASILPAGMEIAIVGDDTLLKVTTIGWDNMLTLVAPYSMGNDNNLTFKVKVEPGTSGLTQAELNYFIGGNDTDDKQQFTGGAAATGVSALSEINIYAKAQIQLKGLQIAIQQNSGTWPALDGVIVYIGKIKANKVETVNLDPRVTYAVPATMGEVIVLDGLQLEDAWFDADPANADQKVSMVVGESYPTSDADNSATWYALYDAENLYIFADITDDVVVPMTSSVSPWLNDGIEIFVDIKDRRYDLARISSEQHQVRFNIKRDTCDASTFAHFYPKWGDVKSATSYSIEVALPWGGICQGAVDSIGVADYIATEIKPGKKISFEISIIDADVEDSRRSILNWSNDTGEDQAYNTSKYFGQLTLGGTSALKDVNKLSAKVYPNPASGNLNVTMEGMSSVVLYNITGQKVMNKIVETNSTNLDISSLSTGLYIVEVKSDKGVAIQKVTVK